MDDIFPPIERELGPYRHLFTGQGAQRRRRAAATSATWSTASSSARTSSPPPTSTTSRRCTDPGRGRLLRHDHLQRRARARREPGEVLAEFARVCRPGGGSTSASRSCSPSTSTPPTSSATRSTASARGRSARLRGQRSRARVHSVYVTLAWIMRDWLGPKRNLSARALKAVALPRAALQVPDLDPSRCTRSPRRIGWSPRGADERPRPAPTSPGLGAERYWSSASTSPRPRRDLRSRSAGRGRATSRPIADAGADSLLLEDGCSRPRPSRRRR